MKPIHLFLFLCLLSVACVACNKDTDDAPELPAAASAFISQWFPGQDIAESSPTEALLNNGTVLRFDDAGEWRYIRAGEGATLPAGILPESAGSYLAEHYARASILLLERDSRELQVGLDTECKVVFSLAGIYITVLDWVEVDVDIEL